MKHLKNRKTESTGAYHHPVLRFALFLLIAFLSFGTTFAQNSTIKVNGTVVDENGDVIIGANISVVGGTASTVTNIEGKFSIQVKENSLIRVSFIGYKAQNVRIDKNKKDIKVTLAEDTKKLDEVVVTALGISRDAKSLGYARQSIDIGTTTEVRDANLLNMLSGKVSGVQFISVGGPTSSTRVVIRGNNSLTGNNQPLYVIDGIPIMNEMGEVDDMDYGNAANNINPDDIESIEVLKGANAAALYGSDGANGVILITTKKASRKAGLGVSYGFNMMFNTLYQYPMYQNVYGSGNAGQLHTGINTYDKSWYDPSLPYGMANLTTDYSQLCFGMPMLGFDVIGRNGQVKKYVPGDNNISGLYQTGYMMTNSVSIDKVAEIASIRFSYTNTHGNDILEGFNERDRHAFNLRTTMKLKKWLSIDVNTRYTIDNVDNRAFRNNSNRNPIYMLTQVPRDASYEELSDYKNPDGTPHSFRGFQNPYWSMHETSNADTKQWFFGDITLNFDLYKGLRLRLRGATDIQTGSGWTFSNYNSPFDVDGQYDEFQENSYNNNYEALLMYNKRIKKFSINANFGGSVRTQQSKKIQDRVNALMQPDVKSLENNAAQIKATTGYNKKTKESVFATASFGYGDFIYLDVTGRNDWSSALGRGNWSYFYPSGSISFVFSELLKNTAINKVLSFGKIRGSIAKVGNDTGFDMLYSSYSYKGSYLDMSWFERDNLEKNPNIKPETTRSWEVGADLRFFKNRLNIDVTYYDKSTFDQIVRADVTAARGANQLMFNAGEIRNWGTELTVTGTPVRTKDFEWTTSLNWSKNNSEVVSLIDGVSRYMLTSWNGLNGVQVYAEVGKPYGQMYGTDPVRNEQGQFLVNAEGRYAQEVDHYFGSVSPDWIGGWSNKFRWRDLDFGFHFDFKKGGKVWSYSGYEGSRNGLTVQSLDGREEYLYSNLIVGENTEERRGFLQPQYTNKANTDYAANYVPYIDASRPKGVYAPNRVYNESVAFWAGQPCNIAYEPQNYWQGESSRQLSRYVYDASYIKLREVSIGYNLPKKFLRKTPFKSARIAAVGRNLAIILQNTPRGLDPEATSTTSNGQGLEMGFALPSANYGFDLKVSF